MNIVVLAGGNSTEREVSIVSGQGVCGALRERNHRAILLDVYFGKESMDKELFPADYDIEQEVAWMQAQSCGGSSVGVCIAHNQSEFAMALAETFSYEDQIVIEQFIAGREFSVAVVDGKAYPVIEIAPIEGFYDYKNKYQEGSCVETCPAKIPLALSQEMQKYAEMAYEALHLEAYARMDFIMDEQGNLYCLEANTLPGMTPTSLIPQEAKAIGMSYPQLCEKLIEVSLNKYQ